MKFEEDRFDANRLLKRIYNQVHEINRILVPKRLPSTFERICIEQLDLTVKTRGVKKGTWIAWKKPETLGLELNVDGTRKGNTSAGERVVRNWKGDLV